MLRLRYQTPAQWTGIALDDLGAFLQDHAANERKAAASAVTLAVHYPERRVLVDAMVDLAREELEHFKRVYDVLVARGETLGQDAPDPYMGQLRRVLRKRRVDEYLLDRLLAFAVIEARGCERFAMLADALEAGALQDFYIELTRAEARHHGLFVRIAETYFATGMVAARLEEILDHEAEIVRGLPLRPTLH
jgi:tRNA-(ms[2]io[6]A)-hydroxylase